jgi:hypothetical protein
VPAVLGVDVVETKHDGGRGIEGPPIDFGIPANGNNWEEMREKGGVWGGVIYDDEGIIGIRDKDIVSAKDKRVVEVETDLRPRSAFCISCNSARTVRPWNWPLVKTIG